MIVITRYEDRFLGTHTLEDGLRVYYLPLENMTMGTIYPYYYCWIPCLRDVLHHSRSSRVDPSPREHPYCTLPPVHERDVSHVDSRSGAVGHPHRVHGPLHNESKQRVWYCYERSPSLLFLLHERVHLRVAGGLSQLLPASAICSLSSLPPRHTECGGRSSVPEGLLHTPVRSPHPQGAGQSLGHHGRRAESSGVSKRRLFIGDGHESSSRRLPRGALPRRRRGRRAASHRSGGGEVEHAVRHHARPHARRNPSRPSGSLSGPPAASLSSVELWRHLPVLLSHRVLQHHHPRSLRVALSCSSHA